MVARSGAKGKPPSSIGLADTGSGDAALHIGIGLGTLAVRRDICAVSYRSEGTDTTAHGARAQIMSCAVLLAGWIRLARFR